LNTSRNWLHLRKLLDTFITSRCTRKNWFKSAVKVTKQKLNEMLDEKNSIRDQSWHVQINHFQLNCTKRIIQRTCKRRILKVCGQKVLQTYLVRLVIIWPNRDNVMSRDSHFYI
jgi:hypothetical protein